MATYNYTINWATTSTWTSGTSNTVWTNLMPKVPADNEEALYRLKKPSREERVWSLENLRARLG